MYWLMTTYVRGSKCAVDYQTYHAAPPQPALWIILAAFSDVSSLRIATTKVFVVLTHQSMWITELRGKWHKSVNAATLHLIAIAKSA